MAQQCVNGIPRVSDEKIVNYGRCVLNLSLKPTVVKLDAFRYMHSISYVIV